jgi:hypothetical protein
VSTDFIYVSTDFICRHPDLRTQVETLRRTRSSQPTGDPLIIPMPRRLQAPSSADSASNPPTNGASVARK